MRGRLLAVLIGFLVVVGAAPASAAPAAPRSAWAAFSAASSTTGTATLAAGFPSIGYAGDAAVGVATSATVRAGAGAGVEYGASTGSTYLTLAPVSSSQPSTTILTFAAPAASSGWSFVLGDIDAETVRITAVGPGGPLTPAQLGFQGGFSDLKPAGADVAVWDAASSSLRGGYPDGRNTDGAFAWFSPSVTVTSITLVSTRVAGFPLAQFWLVGHVATLQGTVSTPDGAPASGAQVSLVPSDGVGGSIASTPVTAVADATGAFSVPDVLAVPMVATVTATERPARGTLVVPLRVAAPADPLDPPDAGEPPRTVPVWDVPVVLFSAASSVPVGTASGDLELARSGIPALATLVVGALLIGGGGVIQLTRRITSRRGASRRG